MTTQTTLFAETLDDASLSNSGKKCLEQFGKFKKVGLWARMFAGLLIQSGDWYSTKCSLMWKLKATKSSRFYFQLSPKNHSEESEIGWLPTPTCMDSSKNGDMTGAAKMLMGATTRSSGQQIQKTLTDAVQMEILKDNPEYAMELASKEFTKRTKLPTQIEFVEWIKTLGNQKEISEKTNLKFTKVEHWFRKDIKWFSYPTIEDWLEIKKHYPVPEDIDYKMTYQESIEWKGMLPTPNSYDWNTPRSEAALKKAKERHKEKGVVLQNSLRQMAGQGFQLNPLFVEEMMGFPENWTTLPYIKNNQK